MCHSTDRLEVACCYGPAGAPSASHRQQWALAGKNNCCNFWVTVEHRSESSRTHFRLWFGFGMISNCWLAGNRERLSASLSHSPSGRRIFAEQLITNWQIVSKVPYFSCMQILMSNYAYCFLDLQLSFTLRSLEASSSCYLILQESATGCMQDFGWAVCPIDSMLGKSDLHRCPKQRENWTCHCSLPFHSQSAHQGPGALLSVAYYVPICSHVRDVCAILPA